MKIIDLEYTGKTLFGCIAGDIVEFIPKKRVPSFQDGQLFVVQGFVNGNAVLARIDRYQLCFVNGLKEIDSILESLRSDYDIAPISFDNFKEVYPRRI